MKFLLAIILTISLHTSNAQSPIGKQTTTYYCDSLKRVCDSLKTQLFLANYKITKVKYYLNIVARKPSQSKYLRGWMIRAVK